MKSNYQDFPDFENLFLEDSYVLDIQTDPEVCIYIEVVLTKKHLLYSKPKPNEIYCYRKAVIRFSKVKAVTWMSKTMIPSIDARNEIDFGNIDEMFSLGNKYHISGDWGELEVISFPPVIEFN